MTVLKFVPGKMIVEISESIVCCSGPYRGQKRRKCEDVSDIRSQFGFWQNFDYNIIIK